MRSAGVETAIGGTDVGGDGREDVSKERRGKNALLGAAPGARSIAARRGVDGLQTSGAFGACLAASPPAGCRFRAGE